MEWSPNVEVPLCVLELIVKNVEKVNESISDPFDKARLEQSKILIERHIGLFKENE